MLKDAKKSAHSIAGCAVAISLSAGAALAQDMADPAWTASSTYTADVTGVVDGGASRAGRYLDNLDVVIDGDLEATFGWRGANLHLYLLNNSGGQPNDLAGTLQGVDNIEVSRQRARLYELWVEQRFAGDRASLLAGLYDLNSEFYATEASGLLIAPPFGIGSEIASTGPNGPSIFPSTALAARLKVSGANGAYLQTAVVNAKASTIGDPDGPDTNMDRGALTIGEAGVGDGSRLAVGLWRYTEKQDDIRDLTPAGNPDRSTAQGAYVLTEQPLIDGGDQGRTVAGFLRAGVSDGDTTVFKGGWQAGLLVTRVFAGRPDSAFSVGLEQGLLSSKGRANLRDAGLDPAHAESSVEITYADKIHPRVTLQPDLQLIKNAGGDRDRDLVVVAALRLTIELF
ncbi:carbohydrate porin [Phenylobacterium sp.]|jgi:porin|uniref:carbohydrate porin n=1 Tax=Phenylobacterium sp. TaxID=1871053 RepID=UPI002F941EA6